MTWLRCFNARLFIHARSSPRLESAICSGTQGPIAKKAKSWATISSIEPASTSIIVWGKITEASNRDVIPCVALGSLKPRRVSAVLLTNYAIICAHGASWEWKLGSITLSTYPAKAPLSIKERVKMSVSSEVIRPSNFLGVTCKIIGELVTLIKATRMPISNVTPNAKIKLLSRNIEIRVLLPVTEISRKLLQHSGV